MKTVILFAFLIISSLPTLCQNKIAKFRAKEMVASSTGGEKIGPYRVDFLVAFNFGASRITFFREKKEVYDIIKTIIDSKDDKGSWSLYTCTDENLQEYEVMFFIPNTQDKVIFSIQKKGSTVTSVVTCAYL